MVVSLYAVRFGHSFGRVPYLDYQRPRDQIAPKVFLLFIIYLFMLINFMAYHMLNVFFCLCPLIVFICLPYESGPSEENDFFL